MIITGMETRRQFRLMTYNVHSCVGTDRQLSLERVADVIAMYRPDIVALQELDVRRVRSGGVDQAYALAERLKMKFYFHPAIEVEEEQYGDAILSWHPLELVRAAALPTVFTRRKKLSQRGALLVKVEVNGQHVWVLNTHLGLNSRERVAQVRALLGPEWLGSPDCRFPYILCGDFNAIPGSPAYRLMYRALRESQRCVPGRHRFRTFPTRYPIFRLDHIFVSPGITVRQVCVPRTLQSRVASDHFPLYADLELDENDSAAGQ